MSISHIVTLGFGNGTLEGSPSLVVTLGFGGEAEDVPLVIAYPLIRLNESQRGPNNMIDERRSVGLGDTRTALGAILSYGDVPADLQGLSVTFKAVNADTLAEVIAESSANVTVEPEQAVTVDASTGKIKGYSLGVKSGDIIRFVASVMPVGLSAGVFYRVGIRWPDGFYVEDCEGKRISPTTTGTAVKVVVVGQVAYQWQPADVDTALTLDCVFRVVDGSAKDTFPVSRRLLVEVVE